MAAYLLAIAAPLCTFAAMEDFRIGIHTEDHRQGGNTGTIEYTPWAVQDDGGWSTFAGDSNFYGPDGLKIGIETADLGNGDGFVADTDFRLALQTCVGTSVSACSSDTSDTQYTSWVSELGVIGVYSGWAEVATRFMDGWRVAIETRESIGLQITDIKVGVQIEYSTEGDVQTTQSVDGDVTSSWSDWAYNAAKDNGAIDQVRIYLQAGSREETMGQIILSTSYYGTVVLKDGVLEGWGSPLYMDPSYPNGVTSAQLIPMVLTLGGEDDDFVIKELIAGITPHCAVSEGGKARCWGQPSYGQLGTGNTAYYSDATNFGKDIDLGSGFVVDSGDCGHLFCCFLSTDNGLKCFGNNRHGQLGYEDTLQRGDNLGEMGEYLDYVNLGSGFNATEVATGQRYSCALSQDKRVKCWGNNGYGSLGQGSTTQRGDGVNEMGNYLAAINFGSHVPEDRLRCGGRYHCCVVTQDNELLCWGYNANGQLGLGHTANIGDSSGDMGNALSTAKLGDDFILADYAVSHSTCVLSTVGKIKCFGYNGQGQLGYGHTANMGSSSDTIGNYLPYVDLGTDFVVATLGFGSGFHQCAASTNDEVKCWGEGTSGQLGIGTQIDMGDAAGEMGNALSTVDLSTRAPTTAEPTTSEPTMHPTTICSSSAGMLIDDVLECSVSVSNIESRVTALEDDDDAQTTVPVWFVEAVYVLMAMNVVLVVAVVGMVMKWRQPVVYSKVMEYDSECAKLSEIVGQ